MKAQCVRCLRVFEPKQNQLYCSGECRSKASYERQESMSRQFWQSTESVSIIGYQTLISRLNLGLGSAVSVLIFVCVLIIATLFVKGFGTSLAQQRGEAP